MVSRRKGGTVRGKGVTYVVTGDGVTLGGGHSAIYRSRVREMRKYA